MFLETWTGKKLKRKGNYTPNALSALISYRFLIIFYIEKILDSGTRQSA